MQNTEPSEFINALQVNVGAPFLLTQACLPLLRRSPDSAVVFVLDDGARVGRAYWGGYGVSKFALRGLMSILADEVENSTVRVCGLQPGPMQTPLRVKAFMTEAPGTWPSASAYADACVHLLSEAGRQYRGQVWTPRLDRGASTNAAVSLNLPVMNLGSAELHE
jgi:NAD(P)-dependent dehydrogenase (short-subunit alcohol dehydrogenase family)